MKILKNKKGFTLVELLAVIVILALIMSIAIIMDPIYSKVISFIDRFNHLEYCRLPQGRSNPQWSN